MPIERVGLVGLAGIGKTTVAHHLHEQHGYAHFYVGDKIKADIVETSGRPGPFSRTQTAEFYRVMRMRNPEYMTGPINAVEGRLVVDGFRNLLDAEDFKANGGFLLGLAANIDERIKRDAQRRGGAPLDTLDFIMQERHELDSDDPNGMQILGILEVADVTIETSRMTAEETLQAVEDALELEHRTASYDLDTY